MIAALWARVQGWALMALAVAAVLVGAYAAGSRSARRAAEVERLNREVAGEKAARKAQERARTDRNAIDHAIRNLPAGDSADRLRNEFNRDR